MIIMSVKRSKEKKKEARKKRVGNNNVSRKLRFPQGLSFLLLVS